MSTDTLSTFLALLALGCAAGAVFGIVLQPVAWEAVAKFLNALQVFAIGVSWGGYESLAIRVDPTRIRTATRWNPGGPLVRLQIGLEDVDDLIADLERGFAAMSAQR